MAWHSGLHPIPDSSVQLPLTKYYQKQTPVEMPKKNGASMGFHDPTCHIIYQRWHRLTVKQSTMIGFPEIRGPISLTKPPFGVKNSCDVAIIWPYQWSSKLSPPKQTNHGDLRSPWLPATYPSPGMILQVSPPKKNKQKSSTMVTNHLLNGMNQPLTTY